MDSFELNKFLGGALAALVFVMGLSVLSDIIFDEKALYEPAYAIAIAEHEDEMKDEEEEETPFAILLASADPAAGEASARVCGACHSFDEGGANGIGPALYNVVGRDIGGGEGFGYSSALTTYGEGKTWNYEELDGFLENPTAWISGTIMGYAGIKDPQERANVVAYMKSVSPDAPPYPEPPAQESEVAAVDAGATTTDASADGDAPEGTEVAAVDTETATGTGAGTEAATPPPGQGDAFHQLVASADPAAGEAAAAICMACHSAAEGEPAKLGPNLYGVYNAPVAGVDGYAYSDALTAHGETLGRWGLDGLNSFLEAPMDVVQGTKMAFPGIKDEGQRASIIAWLHSISPEAGPLTPGGGTQEAAVEPAGDAGATGGDAPAEAAPAPAPTDDNTSADPDTTAPETGGATPATEDAATQAPAPSTDGESNASGSEQAPNGEAERTDAGDSAAGDDETASTGSSTVEAAASGDGGNVTIEPASPANIEIVSPSRTDG